MAETLTTREFRANLAAKGLDFLYVGKPDDDRARIRFPGKFQGTDVIWDATVMTLTRYNAREAEADRPPSRRQFIDIVPDSGTTRSIVICLDIEHIDRPALLKTVIMVRKYKRLRTGRHEFGAAGRQ